MSAATASPTSNRPAGTALPTATTTPATSDPGIFGRGSTNRGIHAGARRSSEGDDQTVDVLSLIRRGSVKRGPPTSSEIHSFTLKSTGLTEAKRTAIIIWSGRGTGRGCVAQSRTALASPASS